MRTLFVLLILFSQELWAKRTLLGRVSDRDGFKIEANCFFSGNQPQVFQSGVILRVSCYGGEDLYSKLLLIRANTSTIVLLESQLGQLLGEPVTDGKSVFITEFDASGTKAFYQINENVRTEIKLPSEVKMIQGLALSQERLLIRYQNSSGLFHQLSFYRSRWESGLEKNVSFYFQPMANESIIVQKVRLGSEGELQESQPDEIRISKDGGKSFQTVLQDRDANPQSPVIGFWNFSVVNGENWVVLARSLSGPIAIIGKGLTTRSLSLDEFEKIDSFPPAIDLMGRVYLRAQKDGVYGLWRVGEKSELILRSGDTFQGDKDVLRVRQEIYNSPVIEGNRLFLGVGVEDFNTATPMGQALVELTIP